MKFWKTKHGWVIRLGGFIVELVTNFTWDEWGFSFSWRTDETWHKLWHFQLPKLWGRSSIPRNPWYRHYGKIK